MPSTSNSAKVKEVAQRSTEALSAHAVRIPITPAKREGTPPGLAQAIARAIGKDPGKLVVPDPQKDEEDIVNDVRDSDGVSKELNDELEDESDSASDYEGSTVRASPRKARRLRNRIVPETEESEPSEKEEDELEEDEEPSSHGSPRDDRKGKSVTSHKPRGDQGTVWKIGRAAVVLKGDDRCELCLNSARATCVLPLDRKHVKIQRCTYCNHQHIGCSAYSGREPKERYRHEAIVDLFGAIAGFPEYPEVIPPAPAVQKRQQNDDDPAPPSPTKQRRTITSVRDKKGKAKQRAPDNELSTAALRSSSSSSARNASAGPSTAVVAGVPPRSFSSMSDRSMNKARPGAKTGLAALRDEYRYLRRQELEMSQQADKVLKTIRELEAGDNE
ncbi:hypothetical protein BC629DRAFT_1593555 [Irpex lacteus]|nr:hypothetical protein BC629DRAFT_1593555 [Irpex lacteus]